MKKKHLLVLASTLLLFLPTIVHAEEITGKISATDGVNIRSIAGTTGASLGKVDYGKSVTIDLEKAKQTQDSSTGCGSGVWYYITSPKTGYICSTYVYMSKPTPSITKEEMAALTEEEFIEYLKKEGFPESYHEKLLNLHKKHPTWIFKGIQTYRDWDNVLKDESVLGTSLIQLTKSRETLGYQGYLATNSSVFDWQKDKFKALESGTWYAANKQTVAYYLDPRNFLTESSVFMFQDLSYDASHTKDMVEKILQSDYTDLILKAAKEANVSALFLATRIRQEGSLTTKATSGGSFTCDGKKYSGYYNFYNIGANTDGDPANNALCYAVARGWNSPEKAMTAGAKQIAQNYIGQGQYSIYFQKFNTSPASDNLITHQYMTNIEAPKSESSIAYDSYVKMNVINDKDSFTFYVPYYYDMPEKTELPPLGSPNNYLKSIKIDNTLIPSFRGDTTSYSVSVEHDTTKISLSCQAINSKATIAGCGTIELKDATTSIKIVITAQNKDTKTYTITVTKKEPPKEEEKEPDNQTTPTEPDGEEEKVYPTVAQIVSQAKVNTDDTYISGIKEGTIANQLKSSILEVSDTAVISIMDKNNKVKTTAKLATGDKVNIQSGKDEKTYTIVLYGDTNGDGTITALDLLQVQKNILGYTKLTLCYQKAADTNKDGKVTALDLLQVQKDILGYSNIKQS